MPAPFNQASQVRELRGLTALSLNLGEELELLIRLLEIALENACVDDPIQSGDLAILCSDFGGVTLIWRAGRIPKCPALPSNTYLYVSLFDFWTSWNGRGCSPIFNEY